MTTPTFRLEASVDDRTGHIAAAYLRVREGEVAQTKEVIEGNVYADYDADGLLLGIELLGPCEAKVLDSIAVDEPESVKQFLAGGASRELIVA